VLEKLLIGDNAFIGVSHLSHAQARQKLQQLRLQTIVEVVREALSHGATGFTFTVHPTNFEILKALDDAKTLDAPLELLPVLPYAAGYIRALNEKGMSGLARDVLSRLSSSDRAKVLLKGSVSAVTFDPVGMLNTYVDMELANILPMKHAKVSAVLLHEVLTDLGVVFRSRNLFDRYMRHVRNSYNAIPGFVTRNFVRFVEFFQDSGLPLEDTLVMTPMNRIGFQMNPSRHACEECLSRLPTSNVIAMSILAGGYIGLEDAIEYLRGLSNLRGIVVGVSSKQHVETFTSLRRLFQS